MDKKAEEKVALLLVENDLINRHLVNMMVAKATKKEIDNEINK